MDAKRARSRLAAPLAGGRVPDLPEEAVIAAAKAIFERSIIADWDRATKTRRWLDGAHEYRDIARAALLAALPYLREHR